ncbi:MAG: type II toxin-antitoxin system prevent-host-death family antitoxin [Chloroflexi bacterium]|nr:type II toxin-antitoxin system prevent-host-death family antitoxin [Chloroflexota bacterium]
MEQVNVHQAKTHLSRLLERVERGERIIIARAGTPVAVLSPYEPPPEERPRVPGRWKDQIWMSDDFDAPLPEFEEYM